MCVAPAFRMAWIAYSRGTAHRRAGDPRQRRARRAFSDEFKAEAVRLCKVGDRTITQVAADLDLTETALREWVKRADTDAGNGAPGALTSDERTGARTTAAGE